MTRSRYRILGQVGQGQFGRVFCAIERKSGEMVALKDLDQTRYPTKKFLREIAYLVSLRHPNIVSFQGFEHHRTGRYLVMDYCNGGTLRDLMESEIKLSIQQSLQFILDILTGLAHAHRQEIVHCDIKPENILLNVVRSGWIAKISDFGISRLRSEENLIRQSGGYTGSPAYMAPERFYGKYSPASDLYAVGILLYELLAHERPFSGLPGELMNAHLSQKVKIPETIPLPLRSIIDTALRKLPQRRFESAKAMGEALQLAIKKCSADSHFNPPVVVSSPYPLAAREGILTASDPQGKWSVTAENNHLRLENLITRNFRTVPCPLPHQLMILDRRYGLAVFTPETETKLQLFDRRGNFYRGLILPFPIHSLTPDRTDSYQLRGFEKEPYPCTVLIHLKPFRVTRVP